MTAHSLAIETPYTYVWHDNAGQSIPVNSKQVLATVSLDGLTIEIPENCIVAEPIILINSAATGNLSKNKIILSANAHAQVIEYLISDDNDSNNVVNTTIHCAAGSQLQHCIIQHSTENPTITQQSITSIIQEQNSKVNTNIFSFGGGLNRIELGIGLRGHNASCNAASLAYTHGTEIQEVILKIEHLTSNCNSSSIARNVLKDKSVTDLLGKIIVHPGASKTIAELQIKNLLCSPKAQSTNKPELEIYNDDVRCTHGSSTGQIDEDALFYMRSRGIGFEEAMTMLIAGFISPAIESCTIPKIADYIYSIIKER